MESEAPKNASPHVFSGKKPTLETETQGVEFPGGGERFCFFPLGSLWCLLHLRAGSAEGGSIKGEGDPKQFNFPPRVIGGMKGFTLQLSGGFVFFREVK